MYFKFNPAFFETLKSIEAHRVAVRGEAGLLVVPASNAEDFEAIKLRWINKSTWLAPWGVRNSHGQTELTLKMVKAREETDEEM